jgi:HD-like signal output (HDOD) protein
MNPLLSRERLEEVCRRSIPAVPLTTLRLCLELSLEEDCQTQLLVETLEADRHACCGVLILAAALGPSPRELADVRRAVDALGGRRIGELLWMLLLSDVLQSCPGASPRGRDRLWRHSLLTAVLTELLIDALDLHRIEFALPAAMAHDVGHLLVPHPAGHWGVVWHTEHDELVDRHPHVPVEQDHCCLGASLLQIWNAPPSLVQTCLFHHLPEFADSPYRPVVQIVRLADIATEYLDVEHLNHPLELEDTSAWDGLIDVMDWDEIPDINQLAVECLPGAVLTAERLSKLLSRE